MKGDLPAGWAENMQKYVHDLQSHPAALATRQVSQKCLNQLRGYAAGTDGRLGGFVAF